MGSYVRNDYHSTSPRWRRATNIPTPAIGIELEMETNTGHYRNILNLLPDFRVNRPLVETDGSLSYTTGVEIIFPPIHPTKLKSFTGTFARAIAAISPVASPSTGTGMHMNVNTYGWGDNAITVFLAVVNNLTNQELYNIGGRHPTMYCPRAYGWNPKHYVEDADGDHIAATYHYGSRIEMRFPQSTTDHGRVRILIDFITVLTSFSKKKGEEFIRMVSGPDCSYENLNWAERCEADPCQCYSCTGMDYDYPGGLELFYNYLSTTKKGKRVLEALRNGYN